MSLVIRARNVSKQYRLGQIGTGTLSHDLNRWWHRVTGREDPYLRIGELNDRSVRGGSEYVWALRDISFDVRHGEVLGIIGQNGAGKSTLLKILSRTTSPSAGEIDIRGRMASLLEVGTGFHPELSGRENIYLNGAILGMKRKEIARRFDEIVDFAGVERYVDTPVKRYSSGMYVRLAFGVAAHLESEILIVDEVLAVGDAEFQDKCLGKMGSISAAEGRTVLYVSHNMSSMKRLCKRGILMRHGEIAYAGEMSDAINAYMVNDDPGGSPPVVDCSGYRNAEISLDAIALRRRNGEVTNAIMSNEALVLEIAYRLVKPQRNLRIILSLMTRDGIHILETSDVGRSAEGVRPEGSYLSRVMIPENFLNLGRYAMEVIIDKPNEEKVFGPIRLGFTVTDLMESQIGVMMGKPLGVIHPRLEWLIERR